MRTRYHSAAVRGVIKKSDTEELGIEKGKKMDLSPPQMTSPRWRSVGAEVFVRIKQGRIINLESSQ
jgi:hypothetical protein